MEKGYYWATYEDNPIPRIIYVTASGGWFSGVSFIYDSEKFKYNLIEKVKEPGKENEELKKFKEALRTVIDACDQGRRFETGSGGQTIDAQLRRTVINGVRAYPIEEAREILLDNP